MKTTTAWLWTAALCLVSSGLLQGQPEDPVQFSLAVQRSQVGPGQQFEALLETRVEEGWHLYSMTQPEGGPIPTTVELAESEIFELAGEVTQPPVRKVYDPNFEIDTEYIEGESEFIVPVRVKAGVPEGQAELTVKVRYMVCSDRKCLPPQTKSASAVLRIAALQSSSGAPQNSRDRQEGGSSESAGLESGLDLRLPGERAEKIVFELEYQEQALRPGGVSRVHLHADVAEGWHLYSMTQPKGGPIPTTINLGDSQGFELTGAIEQPPIRTVYDPNFEMDAEFIDGGSFIIPFRAQDDIPEGAHRLAVEIRYMVCSDVQCLPPKTETYEASVPVSSDGISLSLPPSQQAAAPLAGDSAEQEEAGTEESAAGGTLGNEPPASFLGYFLFSMGMGFLALLTPCVFPMIPITVSYFTKREAQTRMHAVKEASMYAVGIIFTFTGLGFGLTLLLGAGGINQIAASPTVNFFIAGVFIVFALNLFGVLEIKVPSSILSRLDKRANTSSYLGIAFMALTFSLTSFTCTVPFVGTVMVAALQGNWLWSLVGITGFAVAFALPFFLLAVFPNYLQSLPKSGNWMNSLKIVMGFVELAAALKFLSNIDLVWQLEFLTRPVFITVWLAIALVTSVYLLGWFRFPHEMDDSQSIGALRVLSAIFFLSISFYLFRGLLGFSLGELDSFLPPRDYGGVEQAAFGAGLLAGGDGEARREVWHTDYQEALRVAERESKPVFIDFTGYTCTNCRWMEANIFPLRSVQERFQEMVLVRLYTDGGEAEHERNQQFERDRFDTIALPYYAIMSPRDTVLAEFGGLTRDREEFLSFLDKGLEGAAETQVSRVARSASH
ncbi:MAG TPA: protein-disulfide reductase DsbD domain-containing protein [Acidobacteriota bacterium]|nr:protein-disulfide reductase DsbD domain-containing protein [Acidobacteriota bacterium]